MATISPFIVMSSLVDGVSLLGSGTARNTDYTGDAFRIYPKSEIQPDTHFFYVAADYQASGGGPGATMECYLLSSLDEGVTWFLAAEMPAIASGQHLSNQVPVQALGSYVAVVTKLTGTPKPNTTFKVWLASINGGFNATKDTTKTVDLTFASPITSPTEATEAWVTEKIANLRWKIPARVATTGALAAYTRSANVITENAAGALAAIDGVALAVGERLLLKDGAAGQDNGVYVVTSLGSPALPFVLTRADDMNSSADVTSECVVLIEEGTVNGTMIFQLTTANPITLNTTALTWNAAKRVPTPSTDRDASNRGFVQDQDRQSKWKEPVRAMTTGALAAYTRVGNRITANAVGALGAIDGVAVVQDDRILLKNGAAGEDNGIYAITVLGDGATAFILDRTLDFDSDDDIDSGCICYVSEGTSFGETLARLATVNPILLNVTSLAFTANLIVPDPTSDRQVANARYVQDKDRNSKWKQPVRATTAAVLAAYTRVGNRITANAVGALGTIDGVAVVLNDRILLKNGAAGEDNGIYAITVLGDGATAFILDRATDCDDANDVGSGILVYTQEGTANAQKVYQLATANPITLNVTSLSFVGTKRVDTPSNDFDACTLEKAKGLDYEAVWKKPVRAVTSGALAAYTRVANRITANAPGAIGVIDSVAVTTNDRLLLKNGAAGEDNGIWVITVVGDGANPFILDRAKDCDDSAELKSGMMVYVEEGTNAEMVFHLRTTNPITINVTALTFGAMVVVPDPTGDSQATSRKYVQNQDRISRFKAPVRAATVAPLAAYTRVSNKITANAVGALGAIDGVAVVQGERIALLNGAAGQDNGIYVITTIGDGGNAFVLDRATDLDADEDVAAGCCFFVAEGTTYADRGLELTTNDPITLNATVLTFAVRWAPLGGQASNPWTALDASNVKTGTQNFAVSADQAIVFGTAFPDANFRVWCTPDSAPVGHGPFVDTKVAGGFHIKFAGNESTNVDWLAIHN